MFHFDVCTSKMAGRGMHVRTFEHIQVVTPLTIAEIPQLMAPKDVSLMSLTTMTISAVLSELSKDSGIR